MAGLTGGRNAPWNSRPRNRRAPDESDILDCNLDLFWLEIYEQRRATARA